MYRENRIDENELDLNFEYSPSRNAVLRFCGEDVNPITVEDKFYQICKEETDHCAVKYKVNKDIRYGDTGEQLLDIYFKEKEAGTPIFVFVHGGYWSSLDKGTSGVCVAPLVEHGYRVIAVDYNLCPTISLEELSNQMRKLLHWLIDYAQRTQASSISFCGHSAGAHLVASMLVDSNFPKIANANLAKSIFLISGLYDLRELYNLESVNPGNIFSLDVEKAAQLSPICWELHKDYVDYVNHLFKMEFHLMVAEYDSATFQRQTQDYNDKLEMAGLRSTFKLFKGYDHFNIVEDLRLRESDICNYILDKLQNGS